MKHTSLDAWKKDAEDKGYTVKQIQGFEQFEAYDGDVLVGRWHPDHTYLGEETDPVIVDSSGEPIDPEIQS